jgi:hypothetical protein
MGRLDSVAYSHTQVNYINGQNPQHGNIQMASLARDIKCLWELVFHYNWFDPAPVLYMAPIVNWLLPKIVEIVGCRPLLK